MFFYFYFFSVFGSVTLSETSVSLDKRCAVGAMRSPIALVNVKKKIGLFIRVNARCWLGIAVVSGISCVYQLIARPKTKSYYIQLSGSTQRIWR